LRKNPEKRWNIAKLLKHPFLSLDNEEDWEKNKHEGKIDVIIEKICTSTFAFVENDQITLKKEPDDYSVNFANSTQSPKSPKVNRKPMSISDLQNKFQEKKLIDIKKQNSNEFGTPKYFSFQSARSVQKFTFNAEFDKSGNSEIN
jgi:hypothetical protein